VGEALDKLEEYREKGLSMADLSDLAFRVRMAEEEAQPTYNEEEARYALTQEARVAVRKLFAHDFPTDVTASILGLDPVQVESMKKKQPDYVPEILKLHRAGHHPQVIAEKLGIRWGTVRKTLETLGYEPHYKHKLATKELGDAIRADRAAGKSLGQIAKDREISLDKVKNAVYGARGKHRKK
jgi:DNA-binding CsgD family transcriptional regulator